MSTCTCRLESEQFEIFVQCKNYLQMKVLNLCLTQITTVLYAVNFQIFATTPWKFKSGPIILRGGGEGGGGEGGGRGGESEESKNVSVPTKGRG